jgi:anthranilate synthase component 2
MVLVIDNYDSFTFNLVQYLGELGAAPLVRRNDACTLDDIAELSPDRIVISPGPGRPEDAGICQEIVRRYGPMRPLLGVCLGHQAIGQAFGGAIVRAPVPKHGKTSLVRHDGQGIFRGLSQPLEVARYHSLVIAPEPWPDALTIAGRADDDGVIMAVQHREWPVFGVQFHPESVLTADGRRLLRNFLEL